MFEHTGRVGREPVQEPAREDEEAAVDASVALGGLLDEVADRVAFERQAAEAPGRHDAGDGREAPVRAVEVDQRAEVDVGDAVP